MTNIEEKPLAVPQNTHSPVRPDHEELPLKRVNDKELPVDIKNPENNSYVFEPTTKLERIAFYVYAVASEPYYGAVIGVCVPYMLDTLSANGGYELDYVTKCNTDLYDYSCVVKIFNRYFIDTSSFSLYVISFSAVVQAFLFIMLSSLADFGNLKKFFMIMFGLVGALSTLLLLFANGSMYWYAAAFCVISNVCFGASYVFYYAFLCTLTNNDEEVRALETIINNNTTIQTGIQSHHMEKLKKREKVANTISGIGFASGYIAIVVILLVALLINLLNKNKNNSMQIVCAIVGGWWFTLTLVTMKLAKSRRGPNFPKKENVLFYSLKQTFKILKNAYKLSNLFKVLISWFFMSDALSLIINVAILFAKKNLQMTPAQLFIIAIIVPFSAALGIFLFEFISKKLKLSTKHMIILLNMLYLLMPIYAVCGIFTTKFGLHHQIEIYILSIYHGLLLGSIQSFYRVQFSELIPKNKENEMFALYQITDKGSSWFGPFISALITQKTHNTRHAFFFLIAVFIVSLIMNFSIDAKSGNRQAIEFTQDNNLDPNSI